MSVTLDVFCIEEALARILAEKEAKMRAQIEAEAKAKIAAAEKKVADAEKKAEEAEKKAAAATAAAATAATAASPTNGSGSAAWSAQFKGDFELPLPKSQLKKTGDQVCCSWLLSCADCGIIDRCSASSFLLRTPHTPRSSPASTQRSETNSKRKSNPSRFD